MTQNIETAKAYLQAKNFDLARQITNKALEHDPDDIDAWLLMIKIEIESGNNPGALQICQNILPLHSNNWQLRLQEFYCLIYCQKKKEARKAFEFFKTDFPHLSFHIPNMQMLLDAITENTNKVSKYLKDIENSSNLDDSTKRSTGIFYHNINDLFNAQEMLEEVHPRYANDYKINATLAANSFQLGKPAKARKYARLALAAAPEQRRMQHLIYASYLLYFPPFYMISIFLMLIYSFQVLFGKKFFYIFVSLILIDILGIFKNSYLFNLILSPVTAFYRLHDITYQLIETAFLIPVYKYNGILFFISLIIYIFVTMEQIHRKFFNSKAVALRDY